MPGYSPNLSRAQFVMLINLRQVSCNKGSFPSPDKHILLQKKAVVSQRIRATLMHMVLLQVHAAKGKSHRGHAVNEHSLMLKTCSKSV